MATVIRAEISTKNPYYIDKHRYYELKHFCLQYSELKKAYTDYSNLYVSSSTFERQRGQFINSDITARYAIKKTEVKNKIDMIENAAKATDEYLWPFILQAVTEGLSFTYLNTKLNIPCGRDTYYTLYRKFFYLLSEARGWWTCAILKRNLETERD